MASPDCIQDKDCGQNTSRTDTASETKTKARQNTTSLPLNAMLIGKKSYRIQNNELPEITTTKNTKKQPKHIKLDK